MQWGTSSFPQVLQSTPVPSMTNAECQAIYVDEQILPQHVCAGRVGHDACQGVRIVKICSKFHFSMFKFIFSRILVVHWLKMLEVLVPWLLVLSHGDTSVPVNIQQSMLELHTTWTGLEIIWLIKLILLMLNLELWKWCEVKKMLKIKKLFLVMAILWMILLFGL